MNVFPAELWALALGYAFGEKPREGEEDEEESLLYAAVAQPDYFLLSNAFNAAWDEVLLGRVLSSAVAEDAPHRKVVILSFPKYCITVLQKRTASAIPRAPHELRETIEAMEGCLLVPFPSFVFSSKLLSNDAEAPTTCFDAFAARPFVSCPRLKCLRALNFGSGLLNLRCVDLRATVIEQIGDFFLSSSSVRELQLPVTLQSIGNAFVSGAAALKTLDLSSTVLTQIGNDFGNGSGLTRLLLPRTLKTIGANFVAQTAHLEELDLRTTSLFSIGDWFGAGSSLVRVHLPRSLTKVGLRFLNDVNAIDVLDLAETNLEDVPLSFLSQCSFREMRLPASLTTMGSITFYGAQCRGLGFDLSNTRITTISFCFGGRCLTPTVMFPPSLTAIESCFLEESVLDRLDFHHTQVQKIDNNFLSGSSLQAIAFPPTLESVGDLFLSGTQHLSLVDLSHSKLTSVGQEFLACSVVQSLHLPSTLTTIGDSFLKETKALKHLDLSNTQLTTLGKFFGQSCDLQHIVLPSTLQSLGTLFLVRQQCALEVLDLSRCPTVPLDRFEPHRDVG